MLRAKINRLVVSAFFVLISIGPSVYADGFDGYTGDAWYDDGYTGDAWYDGGYTGDAWYDDGYTGDAWSEGGNLYTNESGYTGDVWNEGGNLYTYENGNLYTYDPIYAEYSESCGGCAYSYTPGYSTGGGSYGFSGGGVSMRPVTVGSGTSIARPVGGSYGYGSTYYPTTVSTGHPGTSVTTRPIGGTTNIDNSVRYTDNSINNSFNTGSNINSPGAVAAGTSVSVIPLATPQYYTQYSYGSASCSIIATPSVIQNGQTANLRWTTSGARTAYLSDSIGTVTLNGSLIIRPEASRTYTLTVTDTNGRTSTCQTSLTVSGSAPYVSLTQIPYTGFDYGPMGNALYWVSLVSFAVAGAYLLVFYKGGVLAFAGTMMGSARSARHYQAPTPTIIKEAPIIVTREEEEDLLDEVAIRQSASDRTAPKDTMGIATHNGEPRIVILRE